jgi:hypothetical protein
MHGHQKNRQIAVTTPDNYYSRGRFKPTVAANVATIGRGKSKLFSYAEGAVMDAATPGETGTIATSADTNLVGAGGQTIGSHELYIYGISIQVVPSCKSAELLAKVWAESCVTVIYNGKEIGLQIGPPYFVPGQSSLTGIGKDVSKAPPLSGGPWGPDGSGFPFMNNGLAGFDNFMRIPEGLRWQSAGKTDSNMTIVVELLRDVSVNLSATAAAANASPAVTGVQGFTQAVAADLSVDFMLKLHARVQRRRSRNL